VTTVPLSRGQVLEVAARRLRRRALSEQRWSNVTLWAGVAVVVTLIVLTIVAPWTGLPAPDQQDLLAALQPPSLAHPFGTDQLGRDILSRVIYGTRIDFSFGFITTYATLTIGMLLGALAGYLGGWVDTVVMRAVDVVIAFPFIVLILAIAAVFGAGLMGAYAGVLVVGWALYARLTRGEMLVLREKQFVLAAQTLGYSTPRVVFRHAIPNLLRPNLVFSMADMVLNILTLAALSYLGMGVQPPTPEWGAMIADGQGYLLTAWWVSTFPGLTVVAAGVAFSLIGDGLADRLGGEFRITI
jgi:peptide/nickel transport system permease protein